MQTTLTPVAAAALSVATAAAAAPVDLDDIQTVELAEVELRHPVSKLPLGQFITIMGPEHPDRKKMEFNRVREVRRSLRDDGKLKVTDPAEDEMEAMDTLIACTWSFTDLQGNRPCLVAGQPVPRDAARDFYTAPKRAWIASQVLQALQRQEVFIRSSANS